jgi:DNA polymerase-4
VINLILASWNDSIERLMGRNIIHVNAAAFPVQIERLREPKLRSYPLVIAPPDERAIIYALSDEARQVGIRPGMPVKEAMKHCRDVVVRPPDEPFYYKIASEMNQILGRVSPIIEPEHQGHTFVDITGSQRLFGGLQQIGGQVQAEIHRKLQLAIRVGVGTNKMVSKLAAVGISEPTIKLVKSGNEAAFVAPFRVYLLPKVSRQIQTQLSDLNIRLVRGLAAIPLSHLSMIFGRFGLQLFNFARGIDPRPVLPPTHAPSIVEIRMLDQDTNDIEILLAILLTLIEKAARQLRRKNLVARKLRLFIRYSDYKEEKAETKFPELTDNELEIFPIAKDLFMQTFSRRIRLRQIAIRMWDLRPKPAQLSLFQSNQPEKSKQVLKAMDKIRDKFGHDAIKFARTMKAG